MATKKTDLRKPSPPNSQPAPKKNTARPHAKISCCKSITDEQSIRELKQKIAELERFASFPRLNPNPVLEVNSSGKIIFMNKAAKHLLRKLDLDEKGDIFLPHDIHTILKKLHGKQEKELYREVTIRDKVFGERLYLAPQFNAVRIYAHDITERKKMEAEISRAEISLQKERDFTSAILSTAGALVIVLDLKGRIVNFNKTCEQVTGYSFDEVQGKPFWDILLLPEERKTVKAVFRELKKGMFPNKHDNYWVGKEGARHLISWMNTALLDNKENVEFIIGTGIDITEKRQAEEKLMIALDTVIDEKNRLEAVMNALPVGIAIVDELGGHIQGNLAYEEIWGQPRPPVDSVVDYQLYKAWWADTGMPLMPEEWGSARAVRTGEAVIGQILEIEQFSGQRIFVHNSAVPIRNAEGKIVGSAVAIMDITDRKRIEKELLKNNRVIELSNRVLQMFVKESGDNIFDAALIIMLEVTKSRHGVFGYMDDNGVLVCPSMTKMLDQCEIEGKCIHYPPEKWKGLWSRALREQCALYTNIPPWVPRGHPPIRNNLAVPILFRDRVIGLINLANKETDYTEEDRSLMESVADWVAPVLSSWIKNETQEKERKQSEERLRESEEKFRSAFANASIGFAMTTPGGRFVDANNAYCVITGFSLDELKALEFSSLIYPNDIAENIKRIDRMLAGQISYFEIENRYIRKDGSVVWVRKSVSLVRNAEKAPQWIVALVEDVTERKKIEESLRNSEEDLKRAQAVAHIGSWRLNVQKNELLWSDENHRIFGIPKGLPLTYEVFLSTVHSDDRAYVDRKWQAALRGEHYDIEHRIVVKGGVKWVRERAEMEFDNDGSLLGGFGTTQDITKRKHAEEELRGAKDALQEVVATLEDKVRERTAELTEAYDIVANERQRLFSVLEQIPAYVCLLNADFKFTYVNQEFIKRFGDPGESTCYGFLFQRQFPCENCISFMVFTEQRSQQWEWTGPDGKTYAIYDYPFLDVDGSSLILELGIDITGRKAIENDLIESRKKLRNLYAHLQSAVETERTNIAREIHDEFGTILTALNIDLSWLEKKLPGDQHTLIERIGKDVELVNTAIKLVQRISSELRPGVLDYLGFSSAVEWYVKEFASRAGMNWDISIDIITSDINKDISIGLFRILQEALTNIARHAESSKVSVSVRESDNMMTLQVIDNGKGIGDEYLSDHRSYGIMGMRERVEFLGGDIRIDGIPDKGTTVTVRVPLARGG